MCQKNNLICMKFTNKCTGCRGLSLWILFVFWQTGSSFIRNDLGSSVNGFNFHPPIFSMLPRSFCTCDWSPFLCRWWCGHLLVCSRDSFSESLMLTYAWRWQSHTQMLLHQKMTLMSLRVSLSRSVNVPDFRTSNRAWVSGEDWWKCLLTSCSSGERTGLNRSGVLVTTKSLFITSHHASQTNAEKTVTLKTPFIQRLCFHSRL